MIFRRTATPAWFIPQGFRYLKQFRLDPFPVFTYEVEGIEIEKTVFMVHGENSTVVQYELKKNNHPERLNSLRLELRPLIAFRDYHSTTHENGAINGEAEQRPGLATVTPYQGLPSLHLAHNAGEVRKAGDWYRNFEYDAERERGLDFAEDLFNLWSCVLIWTRVARQRSLPPPNRAMSLRPRNFARPRSLAAEANRIVTGCGRLRPGSDRCRRPVHRLSRRQENGDRRLSLVQRLGPRHHDRPARPHSADRQALKSRAAFCGPSRSTWTRACCPTAFPMPAKPRNTTRWTPRSGSSKRRAPTRLHRRLGIRPQRTLSRARRHHRLARARHALRNQGGFRAACLLSGEPGVQLTWMDAKVGDWVVTPRRGKPVEIQALWYNALCIMEDLARRFGDETGEKRYRNMATVASWSFNRLFWNENTGCLYDVTNGAPPDPSIRPNQIFAVSLTHSMLSPERAKSCSGESSRASAHAVRPAQLGTQRSAVPWSIYRRPESERDGAYHQGTVWPWLMGPFITAYIKVNGNGEAARRQAAEWLAPLKGHLTDGGLGHISEIFDGDAPQRPCGCMAQAWSVAEILRAYVEDVKGIRPAPRVENKAPQSPAKAKDRASTGTRVREVSRVGTRA